MRICDARFSGANKVVPMTFKRVLASVFFVIFACLALPALTSPALAQRGPIAAPTGEPATSQELGAPSAAPTTVVDASGLAQIGGGGTFSIVESFLRADIIVKSVMVLLLLSSLWSWAIIINKAIALGGLKRKAAKFEKIFWSGQSLDELYTQFAARNDHPMAAMFVAALREWRRAFEGGTPKESQITGIKERIEKAMNVTIMRETDGIERQLGFLATVGSVAPFIGLFGTVWGIMNSFTAIAARHDTTLAVVAPGIAEALFATALGLFAAVPAVIFYNRFINEISRYANRLDAFAEEFSAILSRQLEEKAH
jgi:biopolymer transport protein TolQ